MSSFTTSESTTFTRTHAKHIAARIASDLARLTSFYPTGLSESDIKAYEKEAIEYLAVGYLKSVSFGFKKKNEDWWGDDEENVVLGLKYVVKNGDLEGGSSDPGGIQPGIDIEGAKFFSFLVQNSKFNSLDQEARDSFKDKLPFPRSSGSEPAGDWRQDRVYGSGGRYVDRLTAGNE